MAEVNLKPKYLGAPLDITPAWRKPQNPAATCYDGKAVN